MAWQERSGRTPIGIDLGRRYVKAAQLSRTRGGWRIEAAATFPREASDGELNCEEARHLRDVLGRQGFVGRQAVLAVPKESLLTGILELPPRGSGAPVDQIARMELARIHRIRPDEFEMAHWELPAPLRGHEGARVMATACTHKSADAVLDCLEQEGMDVRALDVHACAIARACRPALPAGGGIGCILDIGWETAWLAVLYQDTIVYERCLGETGIRPLFETMDKQLDLDAEMIESVLCEVGVQPTGQDDQTDWAYFEDLRRMVTSHLDLVLREMQPSFSYAAHQYGDAGVERLLLVGGGAMLPGIAEHLSSALGTEVQVAAPADVTECPPQLLAKCGSPALTLSVGLAQFTGE